MECHTVIAVKSGYYAVIFHKAKLFKSLGVGNSLLLIDTIFFLTFGPMDVN